MTTFAEINAMLAAVNPAYSAEYITAEDETVDDEIAIHTGPHQPGSLTRWSIQIGSTGDFFINEYGFDASGEVNSMTGRGMHQTLRAAVIALCAVLAREAKWPIQ
jgi:hypothetical protein